MPLLALTKSDASAVLNQARRSATPIHATVNHEPHKLVHVRAYRSGVFLLLDELAHALSGRGLHVEHGNLLGALIHHRESTGLQAAVTAHLFGIVAPLATKEGVGDHDDRVLRQLILREPGGWLNLRGLPAPDVMIGGPYGDHAFIRQQAP